VGEELRHELAATDGIANNSLRSSVSRTTRRAARRTTYLEKSPQEVSVRRSVDSTTPHWRESDGAARVHHEFPTNHADIAL